MSNLSTYCIGQSVRVQLWNKKVNRANVNQQAFSEGYIGKMNRKSSKLFLLLGEVRKGLPFWPSLYSNDPPSLCWKIKRSKMIRIQIPMLLLKMNINMPWLHTAQEFSLQQRGVDTLSSKYLRQQSTATMWAQIPMTPWHCMTVDYIRLRWHDDTDCNHSSVSWRHLNLGRRLKSCRQSRCWSMLSS